MSITFIKEKSITEIHETAIRILSEIGVRIPHEKMRGALAARGAEVSDEIVKMPEALVMESIDRAVKQFTIYGRDETLTAEFGYGTQNFNSIAGEASWIDDETGQRRFARMSDVRNSATACDALEHINIAGAMADAAEVPVEYRCVETVAEQYRYTTKPLTFWFYDRASAAYVMELQEALRGSKEESENKPGFYAFLEPISPLSFPYDGIDLLYETSKHNLPVSIGPMVQAGMSGPVTLAGTVAQETAEVLAGNVVVQTVRPGTPVVFGGICHGFDMKTTQMIFCGPEQALMAGGTAAMGKHYGFPVYINVGLTDSKVVDAQAGLESGMTLLYGALAGADIFGHMGICGVDQATSLDILVMQNEIIGYVKRILRGMEVSDESLAFDVIKEVGPGGDYISTLHTAENFKSEMYFPDLLDRNFYENWMSAGAKTMGDRCREKKERILKGHQCEPLPDGVEKEFVKIVESAKRNLT